MLQWAVTFLILAIVAGLLGFGGIALLSVDIARILCMAFIILFIISFFLHLRGGGKMPPV